MKTLPKKECEWQTSLDSLLPHQILFFLRTALSALPERFAFSADLLLANKMGLWQYIADKARLQ